MCFYYEYKICKPVTKTVEIVKKYKSGRLDNYNAQKVTKLLPIIKSYTNGNQL